GVSHIAYLRFAPEKSADTSLLTAIVTYSREWVTRYFVRQYVAIDPVVTHGRYAVEPFDWEMLAREYPEASAFLADAAHYGVGRVGLSIPVRKRRGIFSLVSFSSDHSQAEWERYKSDHL